MASKDYIDHDWTTEHYVARDRTQVASNHATTLHEVYPDITFNDSGILPKLNNHFEGNANWKIPGAKSCENAFSGNFSYKIDSGNPYSETFELQLNQMFVYPLNFVELKWKSHSEENTPDTRFVIDLQQGGNSYSWQGFEITNDWKKDKWIETKIQVPLPLDFKLTDEVKIYA